MIPFRLDTKNRSITKDNIGHHFHRKDFAILSISLCFIISPPRSKFTPLFRSSHGKVFVLFNHVLCTLTPPLSWLVHDINEDRSLCMTAQGIIHWGNDHLSPYRLICPTGYGSDWYWDSLPIAVYWKIFSLRVIKSRAVHNNIHF